MRRAAANGSRDGGAQAQQALDKLRQAADQLTKGQTGRTKENIQDAQRKAEALASEQKEIESQVRQLDRSRGSVGAGAEARSTESRDGRTASSRVREKSCRRWPTRHAETERDASRKLGEAADTIRTKQLKEMIDYTKRGHRASDARLREAGRAGDQLEPRRRRQEDR